MRINVKNWFPVKEEMCRFRMLTKMLCEVKQKFFGRVGATKFSRANAPKIFLFLVSDSTRLKSIKYVFLNSKLLFFGSLICRKKQFTRILDDSWKSIVLVPHSSFVSKCKKFRKKLSDRIRVRQRVKVFRSGRKKLSSF